MTGLMRGTGLLLAGLLATAGSCVEDPAPFEPSDDGVHFHILGPVCAVEGCHADPDPQQGVDFTTIETTRRTAIGVAPTVGNAADIYEAVIAPGNPGASFLMAKITLPGVDQGLAMPPTDWMLTQEAVELIEQWIAAMPVEDL